MGAGEDAEGRVALERALALTEEHDLPLARLRVLRTALSFGDGRQVRARQAQALLRRLSDQLAGEAGESLRALDLVRGIAVL
jgi:hypothetical protein